MPLSFSLVDEQPDFVVLDKAPGVSFHSDDGAGLVVQAAQSLGYPLYPVHRLDKVTSGLIVLAKNSETAAELTRLFTSHQVEKFYLALSFAKAQKKQGWIKGDMAPSRRGAWKLLSSQQNPAVTYFISKGFEDLPFRAYLLKPFSGKTHQIRVALKSVGAVIAGDELYGADNADRVYLHAYALRFILQNRDFIYLCAPAQGSLYQQLAQHKALADWQQPWQLAWPQYTQPNNSKG